jgi:hypothetical protein
MDLAAPALLRKEKPQMQKAIRAIIFLVAVSLVSGAVLAAPERSQTVGGTISRLDAARQTLVVKVGAEEMKFVWNAETRINGVLSPGAKVTVRYAAQPDGQNLAFQISVGR